MAELNLYDEFRKAKVPYMPTRAIGEFCLEFGKVSKEQFVLMSGMNLKLLHRKMRFLKNLRNKKT